MREEAMIESLLKHGANPDAENWNGIIPLQNLGYPKAERELRLLDLFLKYNAKPKGKGMAFAFRIFVQAYASKEFAARVREAWPREANDCEKCMKEPVSTSTRC